MTEKANGNGDSAFRMPKALVWVLATVVTLAGIAYPYFSRRSDQDRADGAREERVERMIAIGESLGQQVNRMDLESQLARADLDRRLAALERLVAQIQEREHERERRR